MSWFKKKKTVSVQVDPGFRLARGTHYLDFLESIHVALKPEWYLEIGTEKGFSLARALGNTIAIDPEFKIMAPLRYPAQLHLFQLTSDEFFASGFMERNAIRLDFAFLDGMHRFEFLLRDFMNTERASNSNGLIALHDCVPFNHIMADRNWDLTKTISWTGDVWKLLPILRQHRPELKVEVLDCASTGLVLISGLNPNSTVLQDSYSSIVDEWMNVSLGDYGLDKLEADFPFVSAESYQLTAN